MKWHFPMVLAVLVACASFGQDRMPNDRQTPVVGKTSQASQNVGPIPARILFLGNSHLYFNSGVYYHLQKLAASADPPINLEEVHVVYPAVGLSLLAVRDHALALQEIGSGKYDVVVLQEDFQKATIDDFRFYGKKFVDSILSVKARAIFFMDWDYAALSWIKIDGIARENYALAKELGAEVSPVGLAWQASAKMRPDIELRMEDGEHPTLAGTYLAACTLFATIFDKSPVGLAYRRPLSKDIADFLQRVAWETYANQPK